MRRFIIDTDTASDDAAALILAAKEKEIEILGVTAVAGNVGVIQAGKNARAALEAAGSPARVYLGAERPLFHERRETLSVHGKDGMGDSGIVCPRGEIAPGRAADFILEKVARFPGEVEIVSLGPATNIASAILLDRKIMKKVKRIWSMGTPGFGPGNATPVAEFNVYIDAEAYAIMLGAGIPVTVAGFDLCTMGTALGESEIEKLRRGNAMGVFLEKATRGLRAFNKTARGAAVADLPDAVAMAAALWPGVVLKTVPCHAFCATKEEETYGQVIFYREDRVYEAMPDVSRLGRVEVVERIDEALFREKLLALLTA